MAPLFGLRDRVAAILAVVAGLVLSACGGSELVQAVTEKSFASAAIPWDSPKATAETRRLALAASSAVSSSPYGAVQPSEAIEQLLNFGEVAYGNAE